jgi:hypothetical protein
MTGQCKPCGPNIVRITRYLAAVLLAAIALAAGPVCSAQAQGTTKPVLPTGCFFAPSPSMIGLLAIIQRGSEYPDGEHDCVPLVGGSGAGAKAKIVVDHGGVRSLELVDPGFEYQVGDLLEITIGDSGFGFIVAVEKLAIGFCPN